MANAVTQAVTAIVILPRQRSAESTMNEVEHSTISWRLEAPLKRRFSPGKIDISILKPTSSAKVLPPVKILYAHFGQRSTISSTISSCGCAYGKQQTTVSLCGECSAMVGTARRAVQTPQRGVPTSL